MGWARTNELARIYKEPNKAFLLVFIPDESEKNQPFYREGNLEAVGEVRVNNDPESPMLCSCNTTQGYIRNRKRVAFNELPEVWQDAFKRILLQDDWKLEDYRGLWKTSK